MSTNKRYDAHCHIFTLEYVLKEVKNIVHDMLHHTYPWEEPNVQQKSTNTLGADTGRWAHIKEMLRWLHELLSASLGSEEENLNFLQAEAKKKFPNEPYSIIPLMMDVFYLFAYNMDAGSDFTLLTAPKSVPVNANEFQDTWNEILDDFKQHVTATSSNKRLSSPMLNKHLELIEKERNVTEFLSMHAKVRMLTDLKGYYHTAGFNFHLNNLMNLVETRNGQLYPFIAVDPRRPGMVDSVASGQFFEGTERFYGVKLYPRMGYHPQCKPMYKVYDYCSANNIPITFHCGLSGFPPGTTWKWAQYGNPLNFEPIVKKYPNLKINFAHMGSSDPSYQWADTVFRLVKENSNVYTDLSCYTNINDLKHMKDNYWDNPENPELHNKLMFGTDFDVMYFSGGLITMQEYFQNFIDTFSSDDLTKMMVTNPANFMAK